MDNEKISRHCFSVLVENQPGVLARVVGMFAGRGYNIECVAADRVETEEDLERITVVSIGTQTVLDQIAAQLGRLVPVRRVVDLTEEGPLVERGYALLKVAGDARQREKAAGLAQRAGARAVHESENVVIFEKSGTPQEMKDFIGALRDTGLVEVARSGSVAIGAGEKTIY